MSTPNRVLVLSNQKDPLMPCHPARARELLNKGKAAVFRSQPFTIILKDRSEGVTQPTQVKLDPGSKTTGIALVAEFKRGPKLIWAAELKHRGKEIRKSLESRTQLRRSRRSRNLWYRQPRFNNRTRPEGWLPPSIMHRVLTTMTWVNRLQRFSPVSSITTELASFDTQRMQYGILHGQQYQQGTLFGYTVRSYLLQKWNHSCAYCNTTGIPLQVEHVTPRSQGGTDRISNLVLSCQKCNQRKGTQSIGQFLKSKPTLLKKITTQLQSPLIDTAAINSSRKRLLQELQTTNLPVETGDGAQTSFNRRKQGYPKAHWMDAACSGNSGQKVIIPINHKPLLIQATGRGSRQMCRTDKYGLPIRYRLPQKTHFDFRTGDLARAIVTTGKKIGTYTGRVTVRQTGSFKISTGTGAADGINQRFFKLIQRGDGYAYS